MAHGLEGKTEGFVVELKQIFKGESGVKHAFIYGSWAEGKEKLNSDIDIFVVGDVDEQSLISGLNDLEKRLSREINYVIFGTNELKERQKGEDPFIKKVFVGKKIFLVGGPLEDEKIILTKKQDVYDVFLEVSQRRGKRISMKDIKKELKARYGEA